MPAFAGENTTPSNGSDLPDCRKYAKYQGEICITGMSGRVGQARDLDAYKDVLWNKKSAFTDKHLRYDIDKYKTQRLWSYINDADKFDNEFFDIEQTKANYLDPNIRLAIEAAYEAIVDAGYSKEEVAGTRTAVYAPCVDYDASNFWSTKGTEEFGEGSLGVQNSFRASRISYQFDLRGPSVAMDTACSGSISAIECAMKDIRLGNCDQAIIAGSQLLCSPYSAKMFFDIGAASKQCICYAFDERAEGMSRGEAIGTMFIQKAEDARRIHAKVVHNHQGSDGNSGDFDFNHPSIPGQTAVIRRCYEQAGIDPQTEIDYVECHGTGTVAGDSTEVNAIANVFCGDRRTIPLMVGSVKPNMGHTQGAAGFTSIVKCIWSFYESCIPPQINFEKPNRTVPCLLDGRIKVPTVHTPWETKMCGVSGFGIGGTDSHIILKKSDVQDEVMHPANEAHRLFTYGARTEEGLKTILDNVQHNAHNVGYQVLLQPSGNEPVQKMPFRGFTIINSEKKVTEIKPAKKRPIVFSFTGMGCEWAGMGKKMMEIELFRESVQKNCEILKKNHQIDIYDALKNGTEHSVGNDKLVSLVNITCMQVALVDMLNALGIKPDFIVGHSLGEIAAGYADGCLTREEAMLLPVCRWKAARSTAATTGLMAVVGLSLSELEKIVPSDIDIACHNGKESVTISGAAASVEKFITELEKKKVVAKKVDSVGVAFHSRLIKNSEADIKRQMKMGGLVGKTRSSKWLSSAYPKSEWGLEAAKTAGVDYYTHHYTNRVRYYDVVSMLPKDSIIIEIAPCGLQQSTLNKSLSEEGLCTQLMKRNHPDNVAFFLENLGNMYINGVDMKPLGMFQEVKFPVQRRTPMIAPSISQQWSHTESFRVPHIDDLPGGSDGQAYEATYDFSENGNGYFMFSHILNGMKLFPGAGYLLITWEALADKHDTTFDKLPVVFENINIIRATALPEDGKLTFRCRIMQNGDFELTESDQLVVKGKICLATDAPKIVSDMEKLDEKIKTVQLTKPTIPQTKDEIYLGFVNKGLDYLGKFRGLSNFDGGLGMDIEWTGEWIAFLDLVLQCGVWLTKGDSHIAPLKMDAVYLNATKIQEQLNAGVEKPVTRVLADPNNMSYISSDLFKIKGCEWVNTAFHPSGDAYLDEVRFVPYTANTKVDDNLSQYATDCLGYTIKGLERAFMSGQFPHLSNNKEVVSAALKEFQSKAAKTSDEDLSKACTLPDCGLAKLLKNIFPLSGEPVGPKSVGDIIASSKTELSQDRLFDSLSSPDILNAALEIVKYNFPDDKSTIIEVDAASSRMYRKVKPYLLTRAGINYTATDKDDLPKDFDGNGTTSIQWDLASGAPAPKIEARLMVLKNVLHKQKDVVESLKKLLPCVVPGGFILVQEVTHNFPIFVALEGLHQNVTLPTTNGTREYGRFMSDSTWQTYFTKQGLDLVYRKSDGLLSTMYLLRKKQSVKLEPEFFRMEGLDHAWFGDLQKKMIKLEDEPKESGKRLWIISETANSGVFGFVQCLRKEPGGDKVRFALSSNLEASIDKADVSEDRLKKSVVELDLYQNVFRDGQYGYFARKPVDYSYKSTATGSAAYVSVPTVGDPSSAKWVSSNEELLAMDDFREQNKDNYCTVYYAAVNDRDILNNNGEIPKTMDLCWRYNTGFYGYEFAGRRNDMSRVVGLVPGLALATGLNHSRGLVFDVPEDWTMEEAATVPYCYLSVYYALVVKNRLSEGQTILVHSGATAMGTAAIRTALNVKATVYTTVYSEEEKKQLKKNFPRLPNSRVIMRTNDFNVIDDIAKATEGQGVNVILSPFADESLFEESIDCLSTCGQYIEIGRPVTNDAVGEFATKLMQKCMEYIRVDAMVILNDKASHKRLVKCVSDDMEKGVIKPLSATIFEAQNISKAFTEASESRVLDKVLVQIREEEEGEMDGGSKPEPLELPVTPCVTCDPKKVYILCGGLGGFGLELAHWLVQRGARNVILTSRRGITTGYQAYKKRMMEENYKANIKVMATKLTSTADAKKLLQQAQQMGPVGGIFVLSLVLHDHYISELTKDLFAAAADSKINDTIFMDEASRELCGSELDWFVPFSSIASGLGNAAQTNYGFGNSVMERTCEKRKSDGLSGLAIQWGAVGDVGAFMVKTGFEREGLTMLSSFESMGFGAQRIDSCLHAMETFLTLKDADVVGSIQPIIWETAAKGGAKTSLIAATCKVFGKLSMDSLTDDITLGSLGLDSLMGIEMKQMLEKDFEIQVSLVEVRKMTMGRMREIDAAMEEHYISN